MDLNLQGRVAVVTGAASGLGLAFAKALAQQGAGVVLSDVDEAKGNDAARRIINEGGVAVFEYADMSKRQDVRRLIEATITRYNRIDILINNAGLQHLSPIQDFDEDKWEYLLRLMVTGPFLACKYALPYMISQKRGRIINIGSIHSAVASELKSAYVTAKHGLIGFTKALALEGGAHNITAVAVCPSYTRTPLVEKQIAEQAQRHGITESEVLERIMLGPSAVKRLLEPGEIASLVVFLCTDAASAITGSAVYIDCGWTAR